MDITERQHLMQLLRDFYREVLADDIIGFYFTQVVHFDLEQHLPRVCDFWEGQLLGKLGYQGRTFEAHLAIHRHTALTHHHFRRWLFLFRTSVDRHFSGPTAEAAKHRAEVIAGAMATALANQATVRGAAQGAFEPPCRDPAS